MNGMKKTKHDMIKMEDEIIKIPNVPQMYLIIDGELYQLTFLYIYLLKY